MRSSIETNERLKELVKHYTQGNAAAFAKSIEVTQQRFDRLLKIDKKSGKYPAVKGEMINAILDKYPNVQDVWLLAGRGEMLNTLNETPESFIPTPPSGIPYYSADFAHEFDLIKNRHAQSIHYQIDYKIFNHADFWCNFSGHSMEPEITSGDAVAMKEISCNETEVLFGEIYGIVTNNFCTIRRIAKGSKPGYLKLIPSNKSVEYTEQEIKRSSIEHMFHVLCSVKKL